MTRNQMLVLGGLFGAVVIVFSCLCVSLYAALSSNPSQSSRQAIIESTRAPAPTYSPTVTRTPIPTATQTPSATNTPLPTATVASAGFSGVEQKYLSDAESIMTVYFSATDKIGELLSRAGRNQSLLRNEEWRAEMVLSMAFVKSQGADYRALVPPTRLAPMHNDVVSATKRIDKAIDLLASGLDTRDAKKLDQASREIEAATKLFDSALIKGYAVLTPIASQSKATPTATRTLAPVRSNPVPTTSTSSGCNISAVRRLAQSAEIKKSPIPNASSDSHTLIHAYRFRARSSCPSSTRA